MKSISLLSLVLLVSSCATAPPKALSIQDRTFTEIKNVESNQKDTFNSALSFLSKNMKNSNHSIKVKDFKAGKIVAKINYKCMQYVDGPFGLVDRDVDFTVDLSFKPKRLRVELVADGFKLDLGQYGVQDYPITNKTNTEKCQKSLLSSIMEGLKTESKKEDW
tara:strand:- start:4601 stop:5089 length:489 start_codon:yes stop_codon:yes gene_type:complete